MPNRLDPTAVRSKSQKPHCSPNIAVALACILLMASCAESATREIMLPGPIDDARFQGCARTSINALSKIEDGWRVDSELWDDRHRLLEFGKFSGWNEGGIRSQLSLDSGPPLITIRVKATGAFFKDVGSAIFADDLRDAMKACLERTPQGRTTSNEQ